MIIVSLAAWNELYIAEWLQVTAEIVQTAQTDRQKLGGRLSERFQTRHLHRNDIRRFGRHDIHWSGRVSIRVRRYVGLSKVRGSERGSGVGGFPRHPEAERLSPTAENKDCIAEYWHKLGLRFYAVAAFLQFYYFVLYALLFTKWYAILSVIFLKFLQIRDIGNSNTLATPTLYM